MMHEEYLKMFGVEQSGYNQQRVDMYISKIEEAYIQAVEQNKELLHELETAKEGTARTAVETEKVVPEEVFAELEKLRTLNVELAGTVQQMEKEKGTLKRSESETVGVALMEARRYADDIVLSAQIEADNVLLSAKTHLNSLYEESKEVEQRLMAAEVSLRRLLSRFYDSENDEKGHEE